MTDRPNPEQQLAEVIQVKGGWWNPAAAPGPRAAHLAAAIIAAVNTGDIAPIVPAWADEVTIGELTELRALKAKIDGCETADDDGLVATEDGKRFLYADDLLPWLRETT